MSILMLNEVWISVEEVCSLTGEIKETVRRKCKSNKYISKYVKNGKFKIYSVLLSSLPSSAQNKYLNIKNEKEFDRLFTEGATANLIELETFSKIKKEDILRAEYINKKIKELVCKGE